MTGSLTRRLKTANRTVDISDLYSRPMKEVERNVILPNYHVLRDQQIMLIYYDNDDDVILLQIIKK